MLFRFGARGAAMLAVWAALGGAAAAQSFVEDFDLLPSTGATSGWSDNLTLANSSWNGNNGALTGWFASAVQGGVPLAPPQGIHISDGSSNFGNSGLYSYGGVNQSDRALGAFTGLQNGQAVTDMRFGFRYTNNTGHTINSSSISLAYTLEHWRDSSGGAPQDKLVVETLYDPTNTLSLNSAGYANATNISTPSAQQA